MATAAQECISGVQVMTRGVSPGKLLGTCLTIARGPGLQASDSGEQAQTWIALASRSTVFRMSSGDRGTSNLDPPGARMCSPWSNAPASTGAPCWPGCASISASSISADRPRSRALTPPGRLASWCTASSNGNASSPALAIRSSCCSISRILSPAAQDTA
jgi:hypothetical protein